MADKNFIVKNGLTVGSTERISSAGEITGTASTQSVGNSSTSLATTAYVRGEIDALIDSAPGTLNTLDELAAAINDDAQFNTTLTDAVALKAPIASPTFTGNVGFPNDTIDLAHMSDNSVDSDQYVDSSIDTAHIGDDQVTLAKMAGLARGNIIYGDASGNPVALSPGSSGQALTSNGTDISWGSGGKTTEEIEDIVGAMVTGNTETRFTATYDDTNAKLDFVGQTIPTLVNVLNKAGNNISCGVTNAILSVAPKTGSNISVGVT